MPSLAVIGCLVLVLLDLFSTNVSQGDLLDGQHKELVMDPKRVCSAAVWVGPYKCTSMYAYDVRHNVDTSKWQCIRVRTLCMPLVSISTLPKCEVFCKGLQRTTPYIRKASQQFMAPNTSITPRARSLGNNEENKKELATVIRVIVNYAAEDLSWGGHRIRVASQRFVKASTTNKPLNHEDNDKNKEIFPLG